MSILNSIDKPILLSESSPEILKAVQSALGISADGIYGEITKSAFHRFKADNYLGEPDLLGATTARLLLKPKRLISEYQAETIFGRQVSTIQLNDLNKCLDRFDIDKPQRIEHFMAQIAHESGGLRWLKELATGDAYEGRRDLGNVRPGDGRRYKGGGAIQLTGRANYQALSSYIGDSRVMEGVNYVAEYLPFTSAGFWWYRNGLNQMIDNGATVAQVSKRVNGKHPANGLIDRIKYYKIACKVIV